MKLKDGSEIKGENVRLLGPWICALIGAPNPNMVGGPLSHSTIKRGGDQGSNYEVDLSRRNHLQKNTNPI